MTIDDLLKAGDIEQIARVEAPSAQTQNLADAKSKALYNHGINGRLCYENAPSLVEAMKDANHIGWEVVYGIARNHLGDLAWHVWAKRAERHFDPTWSHLALPLDKCSYYALTAKHPVKSHQELLNLYDRVWNLHSKSP
jgi:hypothetical protein